MNISSDYGDIAIALIYLRWGELAYGASSLSAPALGNYLPMLVTILKSS